MSKYVKYPSYKDSGVVWMGEVPKDWISIKFKQVLQHKTKTTNHTLDCGSISFGTVVYKDNDKVPKETRAAYQEVLAGEFLVNPLNLNFDLKSLRTALSTLDVVVSTGYIVLQSKPNIDKSYLRWLLYQFDVAHMKTLGAGVRQTVNYTDIGNEYFRIPPPQEQQTIANYLDKATDKIDTLISKQTKLIELLREKRQAVISTAVTRGLDSTVAMKDSGVEWLGEIPEDWDVKKLKYSLSLQTEKQKIEKQDVIALENIEGWSGKYVETDSDYQGDDVAFQEHDILFGKLRPYLAKVYQTENSGIAFGDILVYRPNKDTDSGYAFYSMISEAFIDIVDGSTYGSKMPRASVEFVSNMPIAVAPKQEQKQIAKYLNQTILKTETLILKATKAIDLLKEKRTALISAAVTGKIDVREIA